MGQKVHPTGFRLGYIKDWKSQWFAEKDYPVLLHEDQFLRREIKKQFSHAGVSDIIIQRAANKLSIEIHTSRPGVIIGKKGAQVDKLHEDIEKKTGREVYIDIKEIDNPENDAQLTAENIALKLARRVSFRRAMRDAVEGAMQSGAEGIKVRIAGRLHGAEIARSEWYLRGEVPLHTLRANIDYGYADSNTTYGVIGVKVWINHGEVLEVEEELEI